jgi:AcrR family transcriptional regulator
MAENGTPEAVGLRTAVLEAARATLVARGYEATSYDVVAEVAGVRPAQIRELFGSRSELVLAALGLPRLSRAADGLAALSGRDIVAGYLRFWETGDNAAILLRVLGAATSDGRVVRDLERHVTRALVRPLSAALGKSDACPASV